MAKITISARIPVAIPIDGVRVDATVTRFTLEQATAFSKGFQRITERQSEMKLTQRKPDERERGGDGAYLVPDTDITARRLLEMTEDERAAIERLRADEEAFACAFISDQLGKHLRINPGQLTEVHGDGTERDITNGADFALLFGGRHEVLLVALAVIARQRAVTAPAAATVADAPAPGAEPSTTH